MMPLLANALPPVLLRDTTAVPAALQIEPDLRVLVFGFAVTLLTALLVAVGPVLQASRTNIYLGQTASSSMHAARKRAMLVLIQVSVCTSLLVSAGLLVQTLRRLGTLDPGFAKDQVVSFSLDPRLVGGTPEQRSALIQRLFEQVKALPDIEHAALSRVPLMHGTGIKTTVALAGERAPQSDFLNTSIHAITPEYFDALGLRLLAGRAYTVDDMERAESKATGPSPVIVNDAFVRRFIHEGLPLGKQFGIGMEVVAKPDYVIMGVVGDAKYRSLREPMQPTIYTPLNRVWGGGFSEPVVLHVRTRLLASYIIPPVSELLRGLDSRLPFTEVTTLQQDIDASLWSEKLLARLAMVFGLMASLIVAAGLYALLSFVVTRRTLEIGIRVALGARPSDVLSLLLRQTLGLVGVGIAIGLGASFIAARAMQPLLYEVSTSDPTSFGLASFLMLGVAGVAAILPALRVLRFEPAAALRSDG